MVEMPGEGFVMVNEDRRLQSGIPPIFQLPQLKGHDVFEASVEEIQHLFSTSFTTVEYAQFCLDRIQAVNPHLEAVIETNPDALKISAILDDERKQGNVRGPLHGIPVLVKDVGVITSHYFLCLCVPNTLF
jgi:amidase